MFLRLTAFSCGFLGLACADTLYLRSGATVQGNYAGGDTRQIKIVVGDHVETYRLGEVLRMEFSGNGEASSGNYAPPPASTPPPPRYQQQDQPPTQYQQPDRRFERSTPPPQESYSSNGMEVPSGTNLVVRMIDSVDSERDSIGKTFRASIDEPVVVNGQTLIPRGADVVAKLVNQRESGKFTGTTSLTLDLMQIQVNGRMVDINTSEVTQASNSRGSRTAKTVGGGAAVGAILGGIFGGGKGAAIGAASGGALGAGAEVATKGQKVKIPSETRLSFLLQQPLRI